LHYTICPNKNAFRPDFQKHTRGAAQLGFGPCHALYPDYPGARSQPIYADYRFGWRSAGYVAKGIPAFDCTQLPSYDIEYAKNGANFKWKMLKNMPRMIDAVLAEKNKSRNGSKSTTSPALYQTIALGCSTRKVQSVFVTHQLNVLSGNTTWFSSRLHQQAMRKFDECWVPDWEEKPNLTGKLGHVKKADFPIKYLAGL
jgi:hypothetical protein